MAENNIIHKIALSMLKGMNAEIIRHISDCGITPEEFFALEAPALADALKMPRINMLERMNRDEAIFKARKEKEVMDRHNIRGSFLLDDDFPVRLLHIADPPVMLYQLGHTDLDGLHIANVVGTRRPSPYGLDFAEKLIEDLSAYFPDLIIVSGLAFGIDAAAHKASIKAERETVAVVAHGLNMIYPAAHRDLARMILKTGGSIVTEYPFGEKPFRQRFLERNRIVAALAVITIVIESDIKGGAMSTANTAFSYSRDVAALPGRISDRLSSGCNHLIRKEKAHLIGCAADVIEITGWKPLDKQVAPVQRNLFPELDGDPRLIYDTLRFSMEPMQADSIHTQTLIPMPRLMSALGEMEFDGIIIRHPGNRFSIA